MKQIFYINDINELLDLGSFMSASCFACFTLHDEIYQRIAQISPHITTYTSASIANILKSF